MKKSILIIFMQILFITMNSYSQNPCYNASGDCGSGYTPWSEIQQLNVDDIGIPELGTVCPYYIIYKVRYCLGQDGEMHQQVLIDKVGLLPCCPQTPPSCITAFDNYVYVNGELNKDRCANIYHAAYMRLSENLLKQLVNGCNNCSKYNCPNVFTVKRFFAGNCTHYCMYSSPEGYPIIEEKSCVQDYCCGEIFHYCWDNNSNEPVLLTDIKFGEGSVECLMSPEPPDDCPPGAVSTRCFNNCPYGQ